MKRLHLFEFEDQRWFPKTLRSFATDWLRVVQSRMRLHEPVVEVLRELLATTGDHRIVDLCSGSGGPLVDIFREFEARGKTIEVLLTDRYPHPTLESLPIGMSLHAESVDAREVPSDLVGCRTIFNGFHHFNRDEALGILRDTVAARQPIGVFEITERRLLGVAIAAVIPLLVWIMTPFIRPFRWSRLAFTYLVPIVPLLCLWDGVISHLRAYHPDDLHGLAEDVADDGYAWKSGRLDVGHLPVRISYLTGTPI